MEDKKVEVSITSSYTMQIVETIVLVIAMLALCTFVCLLPRKDLSTVFGIAFLVSVVAFIVFFILITMHSRVNEKICVEIQQAAEAKYDVTFAETPEMSSIQEALQGKTAGPYIIHTNENGTLVEVYIAVAEDDKDKSTDGHVTLGLYTKSANGVYKPFTSLVIDDNDNDKDNDDKDTDIGKISVDSDNSSSNANNNNDNNNTNNNNKDTSDDTEISTALYPQ